MPSRRGFPEKDCRMSCLGPPKAASDLEDEDGELACSRTQSYHNLPSHLLNLSILKLDGSAFDIIVEKTATLAQLKHAIEDVFISSSDEGGDDISWSHVWGHFCLCFCDQKLLNDKSYILNYGIKDGDQLRFVHHLSINYSPKERRPKNHGGCYSPRLRLSSPTAYNKFKFSDSGVPYRR